MKLLPRLKQRAALLKREIPALILAFRHPGTPLLPRMLLLLTLGYALSPIDLIPDFIPVLGLLDDLLILPGLTALAVRLIPREVLAECRKEAEDAPPEMKKKALAGLVILLMWAVIIALILKALFSD